MPAIYSVYLTAKQMFNAADMLRYDGAFAVEHYPDTGNLGSSIGYEWVVRCLRYTEGRWSSFGIQPVRVDSTNLRQSEWDQRAQQATGFVSALRLAQAMRKADPHGMFMVEGGL